MIAYVFCRSKKGDRIMKNFFVTFAMTLILGYIFLFFGGVLIFESIWRTLVFVSLIIAILITLYIRQEKIIEELEARIKTLESQNESK